MRKVVLITQALQEWLDLTWPIVGENNAVGKLWAIIR